MFNIRQNLNKKQLDSEKNLVTIYSGVSMSNIHYAAEMLMDTNEESSMRFGDMSDIRGRSKIKVTKKNVIYSMIPLVFPILV